MANPIIFKINAAVVIAPPLLFFFSIIENTKPLIETVNAIKISHQKANIGIILNTTPIIPKTNAAILTSYCLLS